jgi:protein Mpv17
MNSNSITDTTYTPISNTNNNTINNDDDDNKSLIEKILKRSSDYINRTRLIGMYGLSLNLRPISTKSLSSAIGFILGDFIAQMITRNFKYDMTRSIRIGAFGALIHGPCGHLFFSLLEKKLPGGGVGVVTLKVIIDQIIWSPLFATLLISFLGITSGCAPYQIYKIISASLKPLVLLSWMIWPLAHFFNFRIVPTKHRLLYSNIIQLIYNVIACYIVTK